jgi:predicted GNAT superfamily acetyltransferase
MVHRTQRGDEPVVAEAASQSRTSDLDPASIEIRPIATRAECDACVALQRATWGDDFTDVVPQSILKVSQRVGGVALGAFDASGDLLGFVFGLTGVERGRIVHWSDMLAVVPRARGLGLGRRLKDAQRKVVRAVGGEVVYWTFDPLIARNAHLNFNRLGARLAEYVVDMYGITDSPLHGGIPTDRIIVAWPTSDAEIDERLKEAARTLGSEDALSAQIVSGDWIEETEGASILPHSVRVETPLDGERLMLNADPSALQWRESVRRALVWATGMGYSVSAFAYDRDAARGYYLMTKGPRQMPNGRTQ